MSIRSVMRVVLAVGVCSAVGLPWVERVRAAEKEINATLDEAKCDKKWGPPCFTPANGTITEVGVGDTVTWRATDGTHTVTPVDPSAFPESGDLTGPDATFSVTFDKPGVFSFYCKHHGSVEDGGKTHHGMWGKIDVEGDETTTTTTAPPPPGPPPTEPPPPAKPDPGPPPSTEPSPSPSPPPTSPPTTSPPTTSPPTTSPPTTSPPPATSHGSTGPSSGHGQTAAETGRPYVGPPPTAAPPSPPPSRAAASEPRSKPREDKERESGPETTSPADATAVPPDELVAPPVPQFSSPTTAPVAEVPEEVPQGDTVAVLKNESGGGRRKLVLLGTLFGIGAFALGVGGWKYATRPSKYWPA